MIIGAFQLQRAQHAVKDLSSATHITRLPATGASPLRSCVVAAILVELLLESGRRQAQGAAPCGGLQSLQIELLDGLPPDQRLYLLGDLDLEARPEPFFLASSAAASGACDSSASAHCSQASQ